MVKRSKCKNKDLTPFYYEYCLSSGSYESSHFKLKQKGQDEPSTVRQKQFSAPDSDFIPTLAGIGGLQVLYPSQCSITTTPLSPWYWIQMHCILLTFLVWLMVNFSSNRHVLWMCLAWHRCYERQTQIYKPNKIYKPTKISTEFSTASKRCSKKWS